MWVALAAALALAGCDLVFHLDGERSGPSGEPPVLVASSFTSGGTTNSLSFPLTIPDGDNRFLVVSAAIGTFSVPPPAVIAVTYAGASASMLFAVGGVPDARSEQWQLVAPEPGMHDVVITLAGPALSFRAGAMAFEHVNQTTPVRAATGLNDEAAASSLPVLSAPGDLVESTVGQGAGIVGPAEGQTLVYLDNGNIGTALNNAAASVAPGAAATVAMTWTFKAIDHTQMIAASLQP